MKNQFNELINDNEIRNQQRHEECLTIISPVNNAPLFEFHRQRLFKQGYKISSRVLKHRFQLVDENGQVSDLIDGEKYYAATYIRPA